MAVAGPARVFISYRRADAGWPARWLADRLGSHFGAGVVFHDVESIRPGDDFAAQIDAAVAACSVLLAVIGPQWLAVEGDAGRRLDDPLDWVRLEIEAALRRGISVIPVLVDGARMPSAGELPPSLRSVAGRQALSLSPASFDTRSLVSVLETFIRQDAKRTTATSAAGFPRAVRSSASQLLADAEHTALSLRGVSRVLALASVTEAATVVAPDRVASLAAVAEMTAHSIGDTSERSMALSAIAGPVAFADPQRAQVIARSVAGRLLQSVALAEVAGKIAAHDPERAKVIARAILDPDMRSSALATVAIAVITGQPEDAAQLAAQAEAMARTIQDAASRSRALASTGRAMAAINPEHAVRLAAEAEATARTIHDTGSQSAVLASITGAVGTADPERAGAIARSITVALPRAVALAYAAQAMVAADPARAAQLAAEAESAAGFIQDRFGRWSALSLIVQTLAVSDPERAESIARSIQDGGCRTMALAGLARLQARQDK
jgi:hypothetical protein